MIIPTYTTSPRVTRVMAVVDSPSPNRASGIIEPTSSATNNDSAPNAAPTPETASATPPTISDGTRASPRTTAPNKTRAIPNTDLRPIATKTPPAIMVSAEATSASPTASVTALAISTSSGARVLRAAMSLHRLPLDAERPLNGAIEYSTRAPPERSNSDHQGK